jgi:hypothetical protein
MKWLHLDTDCSACVDTDAVLGSRLWFVQGMGEPMHNLDNVIKAVDIMVHQQGLHVSHKKVIRLVCSMCRHGR